MAPVISVLIPCYNAERWVAQAIESALAQTWAGEKKSSWSMTARPTAASR